MVVRYEDLQTNPVPKIHEILDFLHFPHTHEVLGQLLAQDFTSFQRQHHPSFEHFTEEQRGMVGEAVRGVVIHLKRTVGASYGVEAYLI
ncbi:hypothetical protein EMCRGX_G006725 [Ephydatia muelleri]